MKTSHKHQIQPHFIIIKVLIFLVCLASTIWLTSLQQLQRKMLLESALFAIIKSNTKKLATCVKHAPQNQLCMWFLASKNSTVKPAFECDKPISVLFQTTQYRFLHIDFANLNCFLYPSYFA